MSTIPRLPSTSAVAQSPLPSPPTAGSIGPPTPRPTQLPFTENPATASTATTSTTTTTTTTVTSATPEDPAPPPPRPPFAPFFTLVQDATTASHFHPVVRYVFSDDEFDPLAVLPAAHTSTDTSPGPSSLSNSAHNPASGTAGTTAGTIATTATNTTTTTGGGGGGAHSNPHSGSGSQADVDSNHGSGQFGKAHAKRRHATNPGSTPSASAERVILVDVAADGQGILAAHSLSPNWQVSGVSVTKAPTWMADDSSTAGSLAGGGPDSGLMLTIEGVGHGRKKTGDAVTAMLAAAATGTTKEKGKGAVEALEELVGVYAERLQRLQGVVDWAEGRKAVEGDVAAAAAATGGGEG